jgi:RimJ/RimL family protein N-acetyltransferase
MQASTAKSKVSLSVWDESDFPIAFVWMQPFWHVLADDNMPCDLDSFVELRRSQNAIHAGVTRGGELGGLMSLVPVSQWLCEGHCVFKRGFMDKHTPLAALELGQRFAWNIGYKKINCMVYPDNKGMIYLLLRAGASREGRFHHHTQREGRPTDMLSFALFEPSWR